MDQGAWRATIHRVAKSWTGWSNLAHTKFVIAFLPRKCLNFMAAVTVHSDFGAQENKICHCFHFVAFYLPRNDGTRCHEYWIFLNIEFQASFFTLLFFILIKGLFSSFSLSATRMVSSAYLSLLIFLLAILIPTWDSSSLAFDMMYSACKLNR